MEFNVPQFIDVEDKLFGQFTFVQIVYVIGGASISYIVWVMTPAFLSLLKIPLVAIFLILSILLAFYPKERYGKPFIAIMEAAFRFYFVAAKLYTWKRIPKKRAVKDGEVEAKKISVSVPNISESNLKKLSWGLDVHKNI